MTIFCNILLILILIVEVIKLWHSIKISKERKKEIEVIAGMTKTWKEAFSPKHLALFMEYMKTKMDPELKLINGKATRQSWEDRLL